jgi:glycosyltransferase involved in cell wall biosynthesis
VTHGAVAADRRLRVWHIITRLNVGGATEAALNACAHLDRDRFDTVLVAGPETGSEGDLRPRAAELGVRVQVVPQLIRSINPTHDAGAFRALRRRFLIERPDVVHTHSSKAGVVGRLAARSAGVPAILHTVHGWSFHGYMPAWRRHLYIALERLSARTCDRVVAVSDLDREKGLAAKIGHPTQYAVIHEHNDLGPFEAHRGARSEARTRLEISEDVHVIGTIGRLSDQKDPVTFVRTASRVLGEVPNTSFVMVGDGPRRGDAERMARELGVSDRLLLAGMRDDVAQLLPAFDVFLLTSLWEGLPLVIPQAMASGVPVVASTADGNREVIRDAENGLLAPPRRPDLFAKQVVRLLHDRPLADRLVRAGFDTARDFSLDRTIAQLERLYAECLDERRRR